jgi:hypothetical protein
MALNAVRFLLCVNSTRGFSCRELPKDRDQAAANRELGFEVARHFRKENRALSGARGGEWLPGIARYRGI